MEFRLKVLTRKSVDTLNESGSLPRADPLPADTRSLRARIRQLAACKLYLRRETADHLAIQRGEDEGMAVREG